MSSWRPQKKQREQIERTRTHTGCAPLCVNACEFERVYRR